MDERLQRTVQAVKDAGADWGILTSPDTVGYATGHVVPIEAGPSPFAGGPTTAFVGRGGDCGVVATNLEAESVEGNRAETELYAGFAFEEESNRLANYRAAVKTLGQRLGVGGAVAIEPASWPAILQPLAGNTEAIDITPYLRRQRATKTTSEMALIQQAAQAAAAGQRTARQVTSAKRSELEVFADIRCAIERFAGERTPITGDFLSGRTRTAAFSGWPIERHIETGDPVLCDLAPRVAGYWGDSCAAFMLGEPTEAFLKLFRAARGALEHALEIMRPGLVIADLDAELRRIVADTGYTYPHHSGHSIGTAVHEWPRIVPYEHTVLETGMVLMIEPGAYDPEIGGARTEWMIEITGDGCRPVAPFDHLPGL